MTPPDVYNPKRSWPSCDSSHLSDADLWFSIKNDAAWLFYGELDALFPAFVQRVFTHDFADYGFRNVPMDADFALSYWLFLSELSRLGLVDYGTSPRGAYLTPDGKRFRDMLLAPDFDWHSDEPPAALAPQGDGHG